MKPTDFAMLRDRPAWPRLNQRAVVVRFMVVAVEQHQVAARRQRVADHFIRRRGVAVGDKIGFVGIENLRRELLRMFRRAFVDGCPRL